MAFPQQQQSYDTLAIIDAIDHASMKELALLKDIHRSVAARNRAQSSPVEALHKSNKAILGAILSRRDAGNDSYSNDYRNQTTPNRIKTNNNSAHLPQIHSDARTKNAAKNNRRNRKSGNKRHKSLTVGGAGSLTAADAAEINANAIKAAEKRLRNAGGAANDGALTRTSNVDNHIIVMPIKSEKNDKSPNARKWQANAIGSNDEVAAHQRDARGRFASKEKSQQNEENQEKAETRTLFKKLGEMLGGKKGNSEDLLNVAGSATGGVLWSAGKEIFDLTQDMREKVVNLNEWNTRRKAGKGSVSADPLRFPNVAANGGTQSQRAYQSSKGNNIVSIIRDQNKALGENDRTIIEELKEIEENTRGEHKAGGSGIAGKLLGAIGAKALGKLIGSRILSGLTAALGGKTIINLLKRLMSSGEAGLPITEPGLKGKNGKPGKAKGVKGKGKLTKSALAAGAAVATGAAAVKGIFNGGKNPEAEVKPSDVKEAERQSAKNAQAKAGEKVAHKAERAALETGAKKTLAKTALKAVPVIGTAISAGMDAVDGYSDTIGQKEAFNIGDNQDVTGRQKAEYTAANVLNMGGLVSGGAGLLATGASSLGFDGVADKLTFDTGDIAKSLDGGVSSVKDAFSSGSDQQVEAIRDGAKQTSEAIGKLNKSLTESGAVADASKGGMVQVLPGQAENIVSDDLNIGGANAANRSFRNNNFGNIKYVGQSDATLEAANAQGEQTFAKYDSPEEGMRGLANQLSSYAEGTSKAVNYRKLTNVRDIITQFAPNNENDTEGYISTLSKKLNVRDNETLDLSNPAVMTDMIRQIATIEGGNPQVTDQFIKTAIGTRQDGKWEGQFNPETLEKLNKQRASKGLEALTTTDKRANPERYTLTDKIIDGAKNLGGSAWDSSMSKLGEFRDYSDEQLGKVFGNVEGLRVRAPDKGLTLPAGDKLPLGLARAGLNPDEIGKPVIRRAATKAGGADGTTSTKAEEMKTVDASLVGVARPVTVSSSEAINKAKIAPANVEEAEGEGWFDSTFGALKDIGGKSLEVVGNAGKNALTSMGVDVDNPMQWAASQAGSSADGLVSGLTSGAMQDTPFSFLSDTVSSILGNKAGSLSSGAISSFSTTPFAPVTDLAGSGIAPVTGRDKESRGSDEQQTSLLERIAKAVESKEPVKKEARANPNKTTETAQPSPRKDIPVSVADTSLEQLFG